MVPFRVALLVVAIALAPGSLAATAEWTGAHAPIALWSDAGNWVGGHVPVAGDNLVFPAGRPTTTVNDLPAGTEFSSISIDANFFERYTISGNPIRLGAGGLSVAGAYGDYGDTHRLNLSIQLAADQTWTLSPSGKFSALDVNGDVDIGAFTLTIYNHALYGPLRFKGAVSGTGRIITDHNFTWFYEPTDFAGSLVTHGDWSRFIGTTLGAAHVLQTGGRFQLNAEPTMGAFVAAGGEWGGSGNTGDLTLESNSTMRAGASWETATHGRRFETIRVTGGVTIEGATLALNGMGGVVIDMIDGGTTPGPVAPGDEFVIIDNDGTDPVAGTFAPWDGTVWHSFFSDAVTIPANANVDYTVVYNGGDGNDVVVRAIPPGALTTTVLTTSPPIGSQPSRLMATVTGGTETPSGVVKFFRVIGGIVGLPEWFHLGTVALNPAGVATISLPQAEGTYYAEYRGDVTHRPSRAGIEVDAAQTAEVPALGSVALAALIGALAVAGVLAFRTRGL